MAGAAVDTVPMATSSPAPTTYILRLPPPSFSTSPATTCGRLTSGGTPLPATILHSSRGSSYRFSLHSPYSATMYIRPPATAQEPVQPSRIPRAISVHESAAASYTAPRGGRSNGQAHPSVTYSLPPPAAASYLATAAPRRTAAGAHLPSSPPSAPPPPPASPDPRAPPGAASVRHWLHDSVSAATPSPAALDHFSDGYRSLDRGGRREILRSLATDYDVPRARVRDLMSQYMSVAAAASAAEEQPGAEGGAASILYRMERGLRDALRPQYAGFLEAMNAQPGGLKLLAVLRADLLALLGEENAPALRALDAYLKEKLMTWLSPAALALHQITWDDPASLLEKIVAYEAVHPIRNLIDLKRRLGVGRRCFGYFHPAIPGEPLIFIEVALLKDMATSIQEVLWDDPPTPEYEARCALFYSISSTQTGLSGINLGKFLLKRVVDMLRRDMPSVQIFATLSPIPGFMQWLRAKLASQIKLSETELQEGNSLEGAGSAFRESILLPEEEKMIHDAVEQVDGKQGIELLQDILKSSEWVKSGKLSAALKSPLMRLCARYLVGEKKRGKALDAVANFHLQNGAMIERINWMADQSENGIQQSAGIMVNYLYRLENIEEYALSYFGTGHIHASPSLSQCLEPKDM